MIIVWRSRDLGRMIYHYYIIFSKWIIQILDFFFSCNVMLGLANNLCNRKRQWEHCEWAGFNIGTGPLE